MGKRRGRGGGGGGGGGEGKLEEGRREEEEEMILTSALYLSLNWFLLSELPFSVYTVWLLNNLESDKQNE